MLFTKRLNHSSLHWLIHSQRCRTIQLCLHCLCSSQRSGTVQLCFHWLCSSFQKLNHPTKISLTMCFSEICGTHSSKSSANTTCKQKVDLDIHVKIIGAVRNRILKEDLLIACGYFYLN